MQPIELHSRSQISNANVDMVSKKQLRLKIWSGHQVCMEEEVRLGKILLCSMNTSLHDYENHGYLPMILV